MANVFDDPEKVTTKNQLIEAGLHSLEKNGWKVEKVEGYGKARIRRITKGNQKRIIAIRTSQDTWMAFMRNKAGTGWKTLSDVDAVLAISVDNKEHPRFALVHLIDGDEMRARFDRAYQARLAAGHNVPQSGRGIWISLYDKESASPVSRVGAGAGLDNPPIDRIPLEDLGSMNDDPQKEIEIEPKDKDESVKPLSISDAKKGLSMFLGVPEDAIEIIIRS